MYCSSLMMYCFSIGLHTRVAKTPLQLLFCLSVSRAYKQMILGYFSNLRLFLLVPNPKDKSPPGELTITFLKLSISCMRLCQAMQNWIFHMFKMSSAVDCRGSKLITPDYYWLWVFFCMGLGFQLVQTLVCTSCCFSILFIVNTFNVFEVSLSLQYLE